jgi:Protein of unknown function (DUF1194)
MDGSRHMNSRGGSRPSVFKNPIAIVSAAIVSGIASIGTSAQSAQVEHPNDEMARQLGDHILEAPRAFARNSTSISAGIDFAMTQFDHAPYEARRRVIDVSGDGDNNSGRDVLAGSVRWNSAARNAKKNPIHWQKKIEFVGD